MAGARHLFEEHTGELQVRLEAPTLPELFVEAGRALAEVQRRGVALDEAHLGGEELVRLEARDAAALLVRWLDELLFRAEAGRRIYTWLRVDRVDGGTLEARVRGAPATDMRTPVKAATFHGLAVEPRADGGWSATVILDV